MNDDLTKQEKQIIIQVISQVNCPIDQGQTLLLIRNKLQNQIKEKKE